MSEKQVPKLGMPDKVEVITHYWRDDKRFMGDYCSMEIKMDSIGGPLPEWSAVFSFSDAYHDRSDDKIEGMLKLIRFLNPNVEVIETRVADYDG